MTINKALFSSNKQGWGTPPDLWKELNDEFHFQLDAATNDKNPLGTPYYYTEEMDGLAEENKWLNPTYVNPPYGRGIVNWVRRASIESVNNKILTVMLIPARTDTKWFHDWIWDRELAEPQFPLVIRFLKGRLRMFDYETNSMSKHTAPFPSMIVLFQP